MEFDNSGFDVLGWWMVAVSHLFAVMRPSLLDVRPQQVHRYNRPDVFIYWIHISVSVSHQWCK